MKNLIGLFLIFNCVMLTFQLQQSSKVTSLDPILAKSGSFLNNAPEASNIISPELATPKANISYLTKQETKENCKLGSKLDKKEIIIDMNTRDFLKPVEEVKEKFGTEEPIKQ